MIGAAGVAAVIAVLIAVGAFEDGGKPEDGEPPAAAALTIGIAPQTGLKKLDFDRMAAAGVDVIRIPLSWDGIQPGGGDCEPEPQVGPCDWGPTDIVVGNAAERGIRVVPFLFTVPGFVSKHPTTPPIDGYAPAAWDDFVDAAVRRYGPGGKFWETEYVSEGGPYNGDPQPVTDWQVWNEPNGKAFFHPHPNAKKYARLLKATAPAIREVDPGANIILGGMFGSAEIPLPRFLHELYEVRDIEETFDAVALHPYSNGIEDLRTQIQRARDAMDDAGDQNAKIWITELGWGSGDGNHPLEKGPEGQARLLTEAYELLGESADEWNLESVTWFTLRDTNHKGVCRFCRNAGLFKAKSKPKPAWPAFREAVGAD